MVTPGRAGFTLVEAIVALVLSTVLVILVGTTFMVQNQYYAVQVEQSAAQDNARMVTELISSELRSIGKGALVTAGNKTLVVRSPIVMAAVCANGVGPKYSVYVGGGESSIDTDEVAGVGLLNPLFNTWEYADETWSNIYKAGHAQAYCAVTGADTTAAGDTFFDLFKLSKLFSIDPPVGSILMLYRKVTYSFAPSGMDPTTFALYRGVQGGETLEFATGMDASAQFLYRRTGTPGYVTSVTGTGLATIDAIRIEAQARRRPRAGGVDDVTYGWGVNVMLRNGG